MLLLHNFFYFFFTNLELLLLKFPDHIIPGIFSIILLVFYNYSITERHKPGEVQADALCDIKGTKWPLGVIKNDIQFIIGSEAGTATQYLRYLYPTATVDQLNRKAMFKILLPCLPGSPWGSRVHNVLHFRQIQIASSPRNIANAQRYGRLS